AHKYPSIDSYTGPVCSYTHGGVCKSAIPVVTRRNEVLADLVSYNDGSEQEAVLGDPPMLTVSSREDFEPSLNSAVGVASLRAFVHLARTGCTKAAARKLGISPMVLLRRVRLLEADFGERLIVHHKGGVSLTFSGMQVLEHVERALGQLDAAMRALEH